MRSGFAASGLLDFFASIENPGAVAPGGSTATPESGLHAVVSRRLRDFAPAIRAVEGRIFVFGAGNHSQVLLHAWHGLDLPPGSGIVVTDPVQSSFGSLPVLAIDQVSTSAADLFVLSSKSFEEALAARMREVHPRGARPVVLESAAYDAVPRP